MTKRNEQQLAKSRLGRLLVNRGYISEAQLDEALKLQASENMLLGEVLIKQGWITQKDLDRTLKRQSRYRYTAAFVTMVAAPFQPMLALAASPVAAIPVNNSISSQLSQAQLGKFSGMQMLDDEALSGVTAQAYGGMPGIGFSMGQNADAAIVGFQHKYQEDDEYEEQQEEQIAYELTDSVLTMAGVGPISNFIEADISVEGVEYGEGRSPIEISQDGTMKFYMPTEIARISMENIRVKGDTDGPTFGNIYMSDISYHPDSSFTIRARN